MNRLPIRILARPFIAALYVLCPNPSVRLADASPPAGSNYVEVWKDDFDLPTLDTSKWGYGNGFQGGAPDVTTYYRSEGVKVQGGNLILSLSTPSLGTYIAGSVQTGGYPNEIIPGGNKYMPLYGYIEARIKFEGQSGMWSSFWLQTPRNAEMVQLLEQDRGTEIDIAEHNVTHGSGVPPPDDSHQAPSSIHFMSYDSPLIDLGHRNFWHGGGADHPLLGDGPQGDGFHLCGLEWTPDYLKVYYDNQLVWTVYNSTEQHPVCDPCIPLCPYGPNPPPCPPQPCRNPGEPGSCWVGPCSGQTTSECIVGPVPHTNEFIILNPQASNNVNAYGPIPAGGFGPTGDPSNPRMIVDYVRHYQLLVTPTNLTATAQSNGQINLTWTYNGWVPPDAFAIERSTDNVHFTYAAGLTGSTHQYQDTGLQVDSHYWYRVQANIGGTYSDAATANAITGPAPASVGNLVVFDVKKTNVALAWTAPGDDGTGESIFRYDLRYSTSAITASNFNSATRFGTLTPNLSGYDECRRVTGLSANRTYYFAIKSSDEVGNWSEMSNVVSGTTLSSGANSDFASCPAPQSDGIPPANVTNLEVTCISNTRASVSWTAPGDDGNTGTATEYDLRYSTSPITASNFGSATHFPINAPNIAGTLENRPVTGLTACGTYHFALKARDDLGNWSGISNVPNATLPCLGICGGGGAANLPVPADEAPLLFSAPSPNPARGAASFRISVPDHAQGANLRIGVFDVQGRQVRSLVDRAVTPGPVQIDWNLLDDSGQRVASGLYMMRVNVGDVRKTFRLVVVR